ncbi:methylmalonyl-CoA mutase family protein [Lichenifustis flavocetrariae]|uniref:Methylmalonyl-CoA mutase family protein n=1 Tax=Lichenifustis flavocetrariae TaxID=2949735 RepID=A0AA41YTB9_9HYPH|nr:methylmalonyl-CoA mutase family protein [Lichenifustis flavocetrariae]MCW6507779.1 methylmalonyl-CoA mutase family protein [Lichenifustis flavocetrariae]
MLLASGAAGLRELEAAGATAAEMGDAVSFVAVADTELFLTIAKLRTLRRLWACVEAACGLEPRPLRLRADTAWRAMTRQDPWTNLLRGLLHEPFRADRRREGRQLRRVVRRGHEAGVVIRHRRRGAAALHRHHQVHARRPRQGHALGRGTWDVGRGTWDVGRQEFVEGRVAQANGWTDMPKGASDPATSKVAGKIKCAPNWGGVTMLPYDRAIGIAKNSTN